MPEPLDPRCIFEHLARHGVDYVLIGGLAAVLHGAPSMTNDADIVPASSADNLERLGAALRELDARLRIAGEPDGVEFDPHPALLASMNVLNMSTRCGDLDLTFAPAAYEGGYGDLIDRAVAFDVDGHRILAASLRDVIHSKETADRPKDRATLPVLRVLEHEIERQNRRS